MTRRVWWWLYEIRVRGWIQRALSVSSSPFIRPSRRAWEWDWRSAARSCRLTAGGCGRHRMTVEEQRFSSCCQPVAGARHDEGSEAKREADFSSPLKKGGNERDLLCTT